MFPISRGGPNDYSRQTSKDIKRIFAMVVGCIKSMLYHRYIIIVYIIFVLMLYDAIIIIANHSQILKRCYQ